MLTLQKVDFAYPGQKPLFHDLTCTLPSNHIVGLLGKNGAGKTSLLKLLAGLLFPTQGQLAVNGFNPHLRQPGFLQSLLLVPEELALPALTATAYLQYYAPFYPAFDHAFFTKAAAAFELTATTPLTTWSYGQRKKFLLAFALSTRCQLLLLDEPTNGLDIPSKTQLRALLAEAFHPEQLILISTHQVSELNTLIDAIMIVDQGQLLLNATLASLQNAFTVEQQAQEPTLDAQTLYAQKHLGGYAVLKRAPLEGSEPSEIDLELLFNAALANPKAMLTSPPEGEVAATAAGEGLK